MLKTLQISDYPSKLLQFDFFSTANDRIACVVSRFQVKLSRAKVQSSGTNFVASQAQLNGTECNSLIFVYCVTFHFIQSPFLLVEIPQQLALQSEFLMLRTFFFLLQMIARSSSWRIGHVNFSRRAGDVRSNLVAMATKMVATWRVAEISSRLKLTTKCNLNTANET